MKIILIPLMLISLMFSLSAACISSATPPPTAPMPGVAGERTPVSNEWHSLSAAAKKEGSVVVYTATIGEARDIWIKTFKEKYGVSVEMVGGRGSEMINKIVAQRNAGLYLVDLMIMGLSTFYNEIRPLKITVPLQPLLVLPEVTDSSKWRPGKIPYMDKDKTAIAFSLKANHYTTINTDMVNAGEITSIENLLAPKWKGKIVINDPSVFGTGNAWFTFMVFELLGRQKGEEYMRKLAKQEPAVIRDQRLAVEWVARGKYSVGLGLSTSDVDYIVRAGAPIKTIVMKEGNYISSGAMNLMMLDRVPNPKAAKLFINWILGQEAGTIMAKYSGHVSARVDASTEGIDPIFIPDAKDMLPGEEYEMQKAELAKLAADIFKELSK